MMTLRIPAVFCNNVTSMAEGTSRKRSRPEPGYYRYLHDATCTTEPMKRQQSLRLLVNDDEPLPEGVFRVETYNGSLN